MDSSMEVQDAQSALAPALPQQQSDIETAAMPSIETTSAEDIEVPATAKPTSPPKSGKGTPLPQSRKASPQTMTADSAVNAPAPAAPYGTRSRNRTGASRPNYAEDKEIEIEYEPQPAKKDVNPKKRKGGSNSRSTTVEPVAIPITLKSTTASTADGNGTAHSLRKEQIPAVTSKAVPTSSPQPNKKRKVNNQQALSITNGTQAAPKKDNTPIPLINQFENGSSILMFDNTGARLQDGKLIADDGTILGKNDHAYMVCEPPGDPYYIGRIMEFLHVNDDPKKPVEALRMNWYYRPRDISKHSVDTRQLFATFNADVSPITALRGSCTIMHKAEIDDLDEYRRQQNCFWFDKFYDRYIMRTYDVIPTKLVVNVPEKVKKVLDERWQYILVEPQMAKELTNASKSCKKCSGFCPTASSVDCAICHKTYHMHCVEPPLTKKPSRGFGWQCASCSRALSRKTDGSDSPNTLVDEEIEEEDEEILQQQTHGDTGTTTPTVDEELEAHVGTEDQIYQCSLWPFRYLGQHCKVEDCLDYDDRIWPRTYTRLGPKFQAKVSEWAGRPVELVKPLPMKKKRGNAKNNSKLTKEAQAALEAEKLARDNRPKWIEDEPVGYVARGEDHDNSDPECTAELLYKPLETDDIVDLEQRDKLINDFVEKTEDIATTIGVHHLSTNFLTSAITVLHSTNYDVDAALAKLSSFTKVDLKEPDLSASELQHFEEAVTKFGSQLVDVRRHVKTVHPGTIVRFYYTWKKSDRGKRIWQNHSGRKGKKEVKVLAVDNLQDDVADDLDDSAFDNDKAAAKKKAFHCKFCSTRTSRQWRRAPNTATGATVNVDSNGKATQREKGMTQLLVALCMNCATVWRKYAVQWEDLEDLKKGGLNVRPKRKPADDPLREFQLSELSWTASNTEAVNTPLSGSPVRQLAPAAAPPPEIAAQPRKKQKIMAEKPEKAVKAEKIEKLEKPESTELPAMPSIERPIAPAPVKKKPVAKLPPPPPPPPPEPVMPQPRVLPCSICSQLEPKSDHVACHLCRMSVHKKCYGAAEKKGNGKWTCDTCANDKNPTAKLSLKCVLCPIAETYQDFVEQPKVSHKKKTEREREKDRLDREMAQKAEDQYKQRQIELGRPVMPREALKRTADHGWAHVVCAVWTPEIRFGKAEALESVEGIPSIPATKKSEVCKVCRTTLGRCVPCHHCKAPLHVECARQAGYVLGFDITPVKGSRRDQANLVTINGETGTMTAAIWCKEHVPTKTIVHRISEVVDEEGTTALQLFVKKYKQADLTQTGAMRKASQVNIVSAFDAMPAAPPAATSNRRSSTIAATNAQKAAAAKAEESAKEAAAPSKPLGGPCAKCGIDVTPRWYPLSKEDSRAVMNGVAQNSVERKEPTAIATAAAMNDSNPNAEAVQCHKCLKKVREPKKEQLSAQEVFDRLPPVLPQPVSSPMVSAPVEPAPAVSAARMSAFAQDIFTPKVPRPRPAWETAEGFPPATDEDDAAPQLGADGYEYLPTWARDEYGKPRNGWLYERSRRAKCARQDALAQERLEQAERAEREARDARQPPPQQPVVNAPGSYQSPAGLPPYMGPPTTAHPPIPRFVGPVVGHSHNSPHLHRPSPAATGSPSMYYPRPSSPPYRAPVQYRPASPPRMHAPVPVLHQPPGHHPALSSYQQQQQQHSAYYSTTRLPPHHLTNGGPPPRPMEASYGRPPAFPHDQPYRAPYPNIMRDDYRDPREQRDARDMMAPRDARDAREVNGITQVNNVNIIVGTSGQPASTPIMGSAPHRTATQDHRVNGGASASPNLRNLLE